MPDIPANAVSPIPFLHLQGANGISLTGSKCLECGAVSSGERTVCAACTARGRMQPIELSKHGKLYNFSVVYRSFPGVKTPFVTAIVDLDGGGTLKGTLIDVTPDPKALAFDMPVDVVIRDTGQKDPDGRPFVSYYFVPSQGAQR